MSAMQSSNFHVYEILVSVESLSNGHSVVQRPPCDNGVAGVFTTHPFWPFT